MRTVRPRVRTLLLIMVMIPTAGTLAIASAAATNRWDERGTASAISARARRMDALMQARSAVLDESVDTLGLSLARELGVPAERLRDLYGVDFAERLAVARARVDENPLLQREFGLSDDVRHVHSVRPGVDAGTMSSIDAAQRFGELADAIDELWLEAESGLESAIAGGTISGAMRTRVEVLRRTYDASVAGRARSRIVNDLATGTGDGTVRALVVADAQVTAARAAFEPELGVSASAAFAAFRDDRVVLRFEELVDGIIEDGLAGRPTSLRTDPVAFGAALTDSARWTDGITRLVGAASADVSATAADDAQRDSEAFWGVVATAALVSLLALGAAIALSRSLTRPLHRIAGVVQAVRDGAFDIPRVRTTGPRELADAASAVNDMAAAIDDSSHDRSTGLLNRRASIDAVARELAAAEGDDRVLVIYLDVDDLGRINDEHGHEAGDRALIAVADALRQSGRASDSLGRMAGDEFLVTGAMEVGDGAVTLLVERIGDAVGASGLVSGDHGSQLHCSVGFAVSEPGERDANALIDVAVMSMQLVKAGLTRDDLAG